jgi:hypothetical protein
MLLLGSFGHGAWVLLSLRPHRSICAIHGRGVELAGRGRAEPAERRGAREGRERRGVVFQLQRHNIRGWKRDCRGRARRVRRCDSLREARQRVVSQSRIEGSIHPAWMDGGTRKGGSKERRKECEAIPTAGEVARLGSGWCCCSHQMSSKRCVALRCTRRGRECARICCCVQLAGGNDEKGHGTDRSVIPSSHQAKRAQSTTFFNCFIYPSSTIKHGSHRVCK